MKGCPPQTAARCLPHAGQRDVKNLLFHAKHSLNKPWSTVLYKKMFLSAGTSFFVWRNRWPITRYLHKYLSSEYRSNTIECNWGYLPEWIFTGQNDRPARLRYFAVRLVIERSIPENHCRRCWMIQYLFVRMQIVSRGNGIGLGRYRIAGLSN